MTFENTNNQCSSHLLLVRPAAFGSNPETLESNAFQSGSFGNHQEIAKKALLEFDEMVSKLSRKGLDVTVLEDTLIPQKPDAVFPNNWVSFHSGRKLVLYPMLAPLRRLERRPESLSVLFSQKKSTSSAQTHDTGEVKRDLALNFEVIDLTLLEKEGLFLEGTGSMVLDRINHIAYACLSPRTHPAALEIFCNKLNYRPLAFTAHDQKGQNIYHTNVMMSIGQHFGLVCLEAIADTEEQKKVQESLLQHGKKLISISQNQIQGFAGNILQVITQKGEPLLLMSESAQKIFTPLQLRQLEKEGTLLSFSIPTIEQYGGGSVRCMLAEIFN